MLKNGSGLELLSSAAGSVTLAPTFRPESLDNAPDDELHFALRTDIEEVCLGYVNSVAQVRPSIEAEPLEDLAASIGEEGLLNPPDYALLSPESFEEYLALVNKTWGTDATLDEFRPTPDGRYLVVAAGHRRTKAVELNAKSQGYDDLDKVFLAAKVYNEPSVHEILSIQMAENTFTSPPPHREAQLIEEVYLTGLAAGRYESMADFERKSPLGITKITNAIHFMQLPESIRALVAEPDSHELNYTRALLLRRMVEPYSMYLRQNQTKIRHQQFAEYDVPSNKQIAQAVEEEMHRILAHSPTYEKRSDGIQVKRPWKTHELEDYLKHQIEEQWTPNVVLDAPALFDEAAEQDWVARQREETKEIIRLLNGSVQYVKIVAGVIQRLPERVSDKTPKQQRRVAKWLSKLSVVTDEASRAILNQLTDD